jgi:hypothetical protein
MINDKVTIDTRATAIIWLRVTIENLITGRRLLNRLYDDSRIDPLYEVQKTLDEFIEQLKKDNKE